MKKEMKYDVALSYAGEDRYYVKEVAEILRDSNVEVFYDEFEESNLWGKNLYTYLENVYKDQARYTIMFCSENYAKKLWTNHEREIAQERAFKENAEYILPVRLDDTEIPGLRSTIAYIDLREKSPYEFCIIIGKKLNIKIPKKECVNQTLHEAVNKTLKDEDSMSLTELENHNKHWDSFQRYSESKTSQNVPFIDSITPIDTYLSDLSCNLTLWRGLNLRRDVRLEEIYVSHFLQSGFSADKVISEIDVLLSILREESQTRHILIVGLAGSGKSTLLKHWALTLAVRPCNFASKHYVPIFLPLGLVEHLSGGNDSWNLPVVELAAAMFCDASGKASPKLIECLIEVVNSGRAIILLDAADEVSEESRPHFRKWYDMVRRSAKRCPIVLTYRPSEYVSGIENVGTYYLRSLKQKQRELFISQWFHYSDMENVIPNLIAQLRHSRLNVPAVAGNPLFLTMICVEFEATNRLSSTPAELLDQFMRILLELWDIERGVIRRKSNTTLSLDMKLRALESIAFYFFERSDTKFSESELIAHVEVLLHSLDNTAKANAIIKQIQSTSGLLIKDRKGYYQFSHQLFQEFFVARDRYEKYIRGENQKKWVQKRFFNPRFEFVMQFYSELLQASRPEIQRMHKDG